MTRWSVRVLVGAAAVASMGNHSCDMREATLACESGQQVVLVPGTCVEFVNPCEDHLWQPLPAIDGFHFEHAPEGVSTSAEHEPGVTRRSVCATTEAGQFESLPVDYVFGRGSEIGRGSMIISVDRYPGLSVTAEPAGYHHWRIDATPSRGIPPYSFRVENSAGAIVEDWTSASTFVVAPDTRQTFAVTVRDSQPHTRRVEITFGPGPTVTFDQSAASVVRGEPVSIAAIPSGGLAPYSFEWVAHDSIALTSGAGIIAAPRTTTTYTVTVIDSAGARTTASTTIAVTEPPAPPESGPTAAFTYAHCCFEVLRLDASGSTGEIVSYAWDFSWVPMNPEIVTNTAAAQYFAFPTTTGTITLTVTDRAGRTATLTRTFAP